MVQIQIGNDHLTTSFSVLEEQPMDMLLGLDMLKRHQCCIDLKKNVLKIGTTGTETSFLAEGMSKCLLILCFFFLLCIEIEIELKLKFVDSRLIILAGDLPECARLSGNNDDVLDDRDLQRALEDSSRDAKKQRQQNGKCAILFNAYPTFHY